MEIFVKPILNDPATDPAFSPVYYVRDKTGDLASKFGWAGPYSATWGFLPSWRSPYTVEVFDANRANTGKYSLTVFRNCMPFLRGDADSSKVLDLTDATYILGWLFLGGNVPGCMDAADVDDSEEVNLSDAIYILSFLFLGGPTPPAPFPACGTDPTPADPLFCESYPSCP